MSLVDLQIRVVDLKRRQLRGSPICKGEIQINKYIESFWMFLDTWKIRDYEQQWKEGLERIKTHDTSCLIASVNKIKTDPYVNMWVLYKDGKTIYIQEHHLNDIGYGDKDLKGFNIENCYSYIYPRAPFKDDAFNAQEWKVCLE